MRKTGTIHWTRFTNEVLWVLRPSILRLSECKICDQYYGWGDDIGNSEITSGECDSKDVEPMTWSDLVGSLTMPLYVHARMFPCKTQAVPLILMNTNILRIGSKLRSHLLITTACQTPSFSSPKCSVERALRRSEDGQDK